MSISLIISSIVIIYVGLILIDKKRSEREQTALKNEKMAIANFIKNDR